MELPIFNKIKTNLLLELSKLYGFNKIIDEDKFNYAPFIGETAKGVLGILTLSKILPIFFFVSLVINGIGLSGIIYKIGKDYSNFLLKKINDKGNIAFIKSAAEDYLQGIQDINHFGKYFKKLENGNNVDDSDIEDDDDNDNK